MISTRTSRVFPIEADGSLGIGTNFGGDGSLGMGYAGGWIWLSPNEKFLFSNDMHQNVTSLFLSESPLRLGFVCKTVLRPPHGNANLFADTMMATASPTGAGGALYVPEGAENEPETVALLKNQPHNRLCNGSARQPVQFRAHRGRRRERRRFGRRGHSESSANFACRVTFRVVLIWVCVW